MPLARCSELDYDKTRLVVDFRRCGIALARTDGRAPLSAPGHRGRVGRSRLRAISRSPRHNRINRSECPRSTTESSREGGLEVAADQRVNAHDHSHADPNTFPNRLLHVNRHANTQLDRYTFQYRHDDLDDYTYEDSHADSYTDRDSYGHHNAHTIPNTDQHITTNGDSDPHTDDHPHWHPD